MRFSDVLPFKGQLPLSFTSTIASLSPMDALSSFWVHFLCTIYDAAVAYFDKETDLLIYNDQIFFLGIILEILMNHNIVHILAQLALQTSLKKKQGLQNNRHYSKDSLLA